MNDEDHDNEATRDLGRERTELGEDGRFGHFRLLRLIDYRRRWIRITWPDGRKLERLRRSTAIGVVVVAAVGARLVVLMGEEAMRAWHGRDR